MPIVLRPYPRFAVCCSVTYHAGMYDGLGTVWNLSLTGWRFSRDLPLRVGQTCSLSVNLPNEQRIFVAAGIVRWVHGEEYGVETLVADDTTYEQVAQYVTKRVVQGVESIP